MNRGTLQRVVWGLIIAFLAVAGAVVIYAIVMIVLVSVGVWGGA